MSGTPTDLDCAASPLSITVLARDAVGRTSKAIVTVRFTSCSCAQPTLSTSSSMYNVQPAPSYVIPAAQLTPVISALGTQALAPPPPSQTTAIRVSKNAQCGQPFFLDAADLFHAYGVRYAVQGLPPTSALRLSDTGILSGIPNSADAQASPLHVYMTATDRFGLSSPFHPFPNPCESDSTKKIPRRRLSTTANRIADCRRLWGFAPIYIHSSTEFPFSQFNEFSGTTRFEHRFFYIFEI